MRAHFPLIIALGLSCVAAPATAQTNERIYEDLDFRFVTPGARAVAMGRTFIGLADDATAAVSNPAGLSSLLEQEFSFEFTSTQIRHRRFFPTEESELRTFGEQVLTPSFFSYVVPLKRGTLSVFRNALQNYREQFQIGDRFVPALGSTEDGTFGRIAVRADSFGLGGAYVLNRRVSIGGSVTLVSLDLASEARSGTPLNPRNGTSTIDSDLTVSGMAGVLIKPTPTVSIGATYNKGSKFNLETQLVGAFLFTLPDGRRIDVVRSGEQRNIDYVLPDRYSTGVSWRARNDLTLLFDTTRVRYSQQITDRFLVVDFLDPGARLTPDNFHINDVFESHAGVEWRHYGSTTTIALRGGAFTDPDHRLRFRSGGNNLDHPADTLLNFRFNTGRAKVDVGATAGVGMTLLNRVQLDVAASVAPDATDIIVSMVVRLP